MLIVYIYIYYIIYYILHIYLLNNVYIIYIYIYIYYYIYYILYIILCIYIYYIILYTHTLERLHLGTLEPCCSGKMKPMHPLGWGLSSRWCAGTCLGAPGMGAWRERGPFARPFRARFSGSVMVDVPTEPGGSQQRKNTDWTDDEFIWLWTKRVPGFWPIGTEARELSR